MTEKTNTTTGQSFEEMLDQYGSPNIKTGEVVEGTVVQATKDWVLIDVGFKSEGQVPIAEFEGPDGKAEIKEGDRVNVYVETIEGRHGRIELSKEKADKLKIWEDIAKAEAKDGVVEGEVIGIVKGGLTVDIGVKAFLPGSQIDLRPVRGLDRFLGKRFKFKVIKFNRRRGNIVLSRRVLLEKEREAMKLKTLEMIQEGMVVEGVIKNITDYGCFVDLGGIDGLLHVTDMSWGRISHPSEMVQVGNTVTVKILKFEPESERVSLGMKQTVTDPWAKVANSYQIGTRVKGKVVSMAEYGSFIELEPGVEGLIHVSEMSWTKKIKHPSQIMNVGDDVEAVILDVDQEQKRISLGLKQIEANPWVLLQAKYPGGTRVSGVVKNITTFGIFIDIGEGIDGLVHNQDMSWSSRTRNASEIYKKGDEVDAVVLTVDPEKEKFALGIKQLSLDPWQRVQDKFPVGSVVQGIVTKTLDFGAIVEISENIEGLVHISEISEDKIDKVTKVLNIGDKVNAVVISLIPEERKIGLSIRRFKHAESSGDYREYLDNMQKSTTATTLGDLIKDKIDVSKLPKKAGDAKQSEPVSEPVIAKTKEVPVAETDAVSQESVTEDVDTQAEKAPVADAEVKPSETVETSEPVEVSEPVQQEKAEDTE